MLERIFDLFRCALSRRIHRIQRQIEDVASSKISERFWVTHYGAVDINPRSLVFWICVESDAEKHRLERDQIFLEELRNLLKLNQYPDEAIPYVFLGIESQETVDRESGGNWYVHWK